MRSMAIVSLCMMFLFAIAGCTDSQKVPKGIIPKEKMELIMWDMLSADRYVYEFLPRQGDSAYNDTAVFMVYRNVFAIHGISRDAFLKSYKFYLSRPDLTKKMFDSLAIGAERRRAEVFQSENRLDSIKRSQADSLKGSRGDSLRRSRVNLDSLKRRQVTKP